MGAEVGFADGIADATAELDALGVAAALPVELGGVVGVVVAVTVGASPAVEVGAVVVVALVVVADVSGVTWAGVVEHAATAIDAATNVTARFARGRSASTGARSAG